MVSNIAPPFRADHIGSLKRTFLHHHPPPPLSPLPFFVAANADGTSTTQALSTCSPSVRTLTRERSPAPTSRPSRTLPSRVRFPSSRPSGSSLLRMGSSAVTCASSCFASFNASCEDGADLQSILQVLGWLPQQPRRHGASYTTTITLFRTLS